MTNFKNFISNINLNHILLGFILISFFYIKNLANKLTNFYKVNIIIFNKLYNKINNISKKNKKNYNKFNKKLKKNFKKIKKIYKESNNTYLKHLSNKSESNKIIETNQSTHTINNRDPLQSNCITVDEENEFEILD
jgi:hypothetical protein